MSVACSRRRVIPARDTHASVYHGRRFHLHDFVLPIINGPNEGILSTVIVYFVAAASGGASHDLRATSCESGGSRTEVDARRWLDGN